MNASLLLGIFLGTFAVLGMQAKEKPSPPFPIDLGVSLIFPRPNETYRPIYPFPIVFALTGAAKAWPYGFKLQWRLERNWTTPIKKEDVPVVYGSAPDWLYSSGSLDPATEPYFVINATDIISNTSYTEWELGWSLSVLQECSPGTERYWKYGSINFSISSSGSLPSYKPKGPCALEIQNTRFLDNRTTPKEVAGDRRSESCVVVTDEEGQGDPCSIDTGSELEAMVEAEMLRYAKCPDNQSWPDEENLLGPDSCRRLYPSSKDAEDVANHMLPATLTAAAMAAAVVAFFAVFIYINVVGPEMMQSWSAAVPSFIEFLITIAASSQPRPLFVYGTLRALPLLAWVLTGDATQTSTVAALARPARVSGHARFTVKHCDYPAVIKKDCHEVDGYVLLLQTISQRKKLDTFEGEIYTPTAITATLDDGTTMEADIYLWGGDSEALSTEPWELETFIKERLEDWLDLFEGMELTGSESERFVWLADGTAAVTITDSVTQTVTGQETIVTTYTTTVAGALSTKTQAITATLLSKSGKTNRGFGSIHAAADIKAIGQTRLSSYHLLYSFESTHQFQTLESTLRFRQADGQELDCGKAKITPDLGDSISAALTFVPLAILIVVTLSSWRVNHSSLTYTHGLNASSLWSVVLEITSYLRYLQFAFITASISIEYPGFFVPAVSKLSWASLLYWSGPFRSGYMYEGPTGGMYTSNASYGLGFMTQMLRYPNMLNTLANSLINLIILTSPIFFLLLLSFWTFCGSSSVHSLPFLSILQKAAWTTISVALCFFSVPLLSYISYDLILVGYLPNYRIGLAVVMLLIILGAGHFLVQVLDDQAGDQPKPPRPSRLATNNPSVNFHTLWRLLCRHIPHTMPLLQAIGVGSLQGFPLAQVFMLIACETLIFISHLNSKRSILVQRLPIIYTSAMRLILLFLTSIFAMPITEATRQWIGYMVLILHGLAILAGFFIKHAWNLYETVFIGEAIDRDSSSHTTGRDSDPVPSIRMDHLDTHSTADLLEYRRAPSREPSTRDFQPDPSTFYRPPRSGATSPAYHAPRTAAIVINPKSPPTDGSGPSTGHFSIDLALSEVAFQPGIDYSLRESDRFYGIDEERVFVSSTSTPEVDTNPGLSPGMRHDETHRGQLKNKLVAGLANAFTKPRPKVQESGFQVKRPARPPRSTPNT
ncbi:hypothetical protein FGADI_9348 [Fusarium gaditjirri]|uniref:Integral membrane protein n=1 Tax=Fusarium gaditjirri TaxID=282569 RepID=A0A8H4WS76_9HYPO|nr:hypothetical protein FGADI_9348 [Fusarium gaditjirri]